MYCLCVSCKLRRLTRYSLKREGKHSYPCFENGIKWAGSLPYAYIRLNLIRPTGPPSYAPTWGRVSLLTCAYLCFFMGLTNNLNQNSPNQGTWFSAFSARHFTRFKITIETAKIWKVSKKPSNGAPTKTLSTPNPPAFTAAPSRLFGTHSYFGKQ